MHKIKIVIGLVIQVVGTLIYSFGYAQNPLEITGLTLTSERAIHKSACEYSKTDTFSYDLKIAYAENNKPKFYYTNW